MNINWNSPDFEGFAGQNPFAGKNNGPRPVRKPIGTPFTRTLINLAVTLLFAGIEKTMAELKSLGFIAV